MTPPVKLDRLLEATSSREYEARLIYISSPEKYVKKRVFSLKKLVFRKFYGKLVVKPEPERY